MHRTPDRNSAVVKRLCESINPAARPFYIEITPEPSCEVNDCFNCIRQKVARDGGRVQFGWSIWERPRIFIEAEHHALYEPPAGPPWLDITPSAAPEITRRLFLPDGRAIYDFENEGIRRNNIRLALIDDPAVQEYFSLFDEQNAILNSVPGLGLVSLEGEAAVRYRRTVQRALEIEYELGMKYTPQGAPCFCGGGEKFKRCHGQPQRTAR